MQLRGRYCWRSRTFAALSKPEEVVRFARGGSWLGSAAWLKKSRGQGLGGHCERNPIEHLLRPNLQASRRSSRVHSGAEDGCLRVSLDGGTGGRDCAIHGVIIVLV